MKALYIQNLYLENYRNLAQYQINTELKPVVIIGSNGSGKTNILEAISLLFPGRGIRNAKFEEICQFGRETWRAKYIMESRIGIAQVENNFTLLQNKRYIYFNGNKIRGSELSKLSNIIWFTPQMSGIFLESPKIRRRFFDRIVYSFNDNHASTISKYEYYLQERNKVLEHHFHDNNWLDVIEYKLAELHYEILVARYKILTGLQREIDNLDNPFPKAKLQLSGTLEQDLIQQKSVNEKLDFIIAELKKSRHQDKIIGKTSFGAHKTDFIVTHAEKNIKAKSCSTGEQKALIISIILAQVNLIIKESQAIPILLLDEVFVHLDDLRKNYLIQFFRQLNAQAWITATCGRGIEEMIDFSTLILL